MKSGFSVSGLGQTFGSLECADKIKYLVVLLTTHHTRSEQYIDVNPTTLTLVHLFQAFRSVSVVSVARAGRMQLTLRQLLPAQPRTLKERTASWRSVASSRCTGGRLWSSSRSAGRQRARGVAINFVQGLDHVVIGRDKGFDLDDLDPRQ